jgi:hypothetical protein
MPKDLIVDEVRKVREHYAATFNFDLDAIYRDLKKREHEGEFTVVYRRPRRPRPGIRARIVNGKRTASS